MRANIAKISCRRGFFKHRLIVAAALGTTVCGERLTFNLVVWIKIASGEPRVANRGDRLSHFSAQPVHIHQSQAHPSVGIDPARPVRFLDVDGGKADAMPLRVFHQRGRVIEPHRLIIQKRRVEGRRIVSLQIRARIHEKREARRVRFRKSIQREGGDRSDDLFRRVAGDPLLRHPGSQLRFDLLHPPLRPLESECAPQFLRFPT